MAPLSPEVIAAGVGVAGVAAAAIYSYVTGESTSASIDVDDDGTDEVAVGFDGDESSTESVANDVNEQANPTPDEVLEKSGLTSITGIQETRAERLGEAGYSTPEDLYYASDENLTDVKGIGPYTVEQIRDDIGGIDYEGNGESDETSETSESSDGKSDESA